MTIVQTFLCPLSLPLLSCVGLREHFIARHLSQTQSDSVLQTVSIHVTDFDLSANLLSTWDDIVSCVQYMTKLHTLNLSENRFSPFTEPRVTCETFRCLRVLVLNDCALDWQQHILCLCRECASLEELHLAKNQLSSLRPLSNFTTLTGLRLLNLSSNRFTQWTELRLVVRCSIKKEMRKKEKSEKKKRNI
jgi:Leucine-rich repeat (LRR) protein